MAEETEEERGFGFLTFLAGAGIGALVGAAVALLMAPQSGRESREEVKEALGRLADRTEQLMGRLKESTGEFVREKKTLLGKAVQAYRVGAAEKTAKLEESEAEEQT